MDWWTCNEKNIVFILFHCQNPRLVYRWVSKDDLPFTQLLTLFCDIEEEGFYNYVQWVIVQLCKMFEAVWFKILYNEIE